MLSLETYDDDNGQRLPQECLEDIAKILEQYGYTCCDHDEDSIVFIAE